MTPKIDKFGLIESEEREVHNKLISSFSLDKDNSTKRINKKVDRIFFSVVILCGLLVLLAILVGYLD